jgi:hypothetical protein
MVLEVLVVVVLEMVQQVKLTQVVVEVEVLKEMLVIVVLLEVREW